MSVYIKNEKVILDAGSVATDASCCCATGACCVGDECTIESESDCTDMEGEYQGDDTTCDPNPCEEPPPPLCPCEDVDLFFAFDGSGRQFLTYDRVISGNWDVSESDGFTYTVTADCSGTYHAHFDSECNFIVDDDTSSSSRTETLDSNPPVTCDHPDLDCFCNVTIPAHNECTTFYNPCIGCSAVPPASDVTVSTATTRTRTVNISNSCDAGDVHCDWSGSYTETEILSDECIPI